MCDNLQNNIETSGISYSISLALSPAGTISGTHSGSAVSGQIIFTGLRILSANTFSLTASSTGITSAVYQSLTIINYVYTIALQPSIASPCANFDFTVTATLSGEDTNPFTGTITAGISATPSIAGSTSVSTSTGTAAFIVYFSTSGPKVVTVTVPATGTSPSVTGTLHITALGNTLKIAAPSPVVRVMQPSLSTTAFSVTVTVYDSLGTTPETVYPVPVTLSLSPTTGVLYGTVTSSTDSGTITLSGIRILSAGTFSIVVASPTMNSGSTIEYTIQNFLYSIAVTSSTSTPTAVFPFTITATLQGEDGNVFISSSTVTLSESGGSAISGTSSVSAVSGIATFSISFSSSGSKIIVATCGSITGRLTLYLNEAMLKVSAFTPTVIDT